MYHFSHFSDDGYSRRWDTTEGGKTVMKMQQWFFGMGYVCVFVYPNGKCTSGAYLLNMVQLSFGLLYSPAQGRSYPSRLLHLYDYDYYNDWNIQYSSTALLLLMHTAGHTALKQSHCAPHLHISSERRHFVTSYVQPIMQQYESTKRTFIIKVATTDDFRNKWKLSCAYHKINTFHGEQRWMEHKGGPW